MARDVLLALDTATPQGVVALRSLSSLSSNRSTHALHAIDASSPPALPGDVVRIYAGDTDHAERLLPELDRALAEAGLTPADLAAVVVDIGPGSFTGVRVGVSSAKGLALALGLDVVTVTSLDVLAEAMFRRAADRASHVCVPVLDARRGEVFTALIRGDGVTLAPPSVVKPELLDAWISRSLDEALAAGLCEAPIAASSVEIQVAGALPDATSLLDLGQRLVARRQLVDAASFEPAYVRVPDATPMIATPGMSAGPGVSSLPRPGSA